MRRKCRFVVIMFICIILVCTAFVMAYDRYGDNEKIVNTDAEYKVVTSFYPMYIAALNIVDGVDGVVLSNLSEPQTGCLHDFQMTPEDMKLLSEADTFIINGGGIESFMSGVTETYPDLNIITATEVIHLIDTHEAVNNEAAHEHNHDEQNAHAWMSVSKYRAMVQHIAEMLCKDDEKNASLYRKNAEVYDEKLAELEKDIDEVKHAVTGKNIIIFHDAFEYTAKDYGMNVDYTLNLDEERSVSAGEVSDVISAINMNKTSVILAEELYGKDMAQTVASETEVRVAYLNPINRGDYDKNSYIEGMNQNIQAVKEAFGVK